MAEEFSKAVEEGIKLSKRIYFGNDRAVSPPKPPTTMVKSNTGFLPTSPMVYAVIHDPSIVDNPDIPSYQPHVHGRCDPPALIPLQMINVVDCKVDCYLDSAFVEVVGSWRLHCVSGSRSCDCVVAVPMGSQGSILGVEVSVHRKSYSTQLVDMEYKTGGKENVPTQEGGFLKPNMFTLTIPQIDGGSNLSIKLNWSQKIICGNDVFSLNVPFNFPDFVNPAGKRMSKKEKILINVNAATGSEVTCKTSSHPMKEVKRNAGSKSFSNETDVLSWSKFDINFSYAVSSSQINGGFFLESASVDDVDQRETFCMYLSSGNLQNTKVFRKDIVFVIDISGSMRGKLIEDIKKALSAALYKLDPGDSFSIIAFNGEIYQFSTSMEMASTDAVDRAIEWININFVAGGDTNLLRPLNMAIEMLSNARSSVPIIFLVTDGTVEDERQTCDMIKNRITGESMFPRIYTFGIGSFCNQYFLKMLAMISKGQHVAALDVDLVEPQMRKLFGKASSLVLANITIDVLDDLDEFEVYPSHIPDLSSDGPLTLSGKYKGNFPEVLKVKGILADFSNFEINLELQSAKDMPVERVFAREQIEYLTAQAWLTSSKEIEQKVSKLSLQTGFLSEYTRMAVLEIDRVVKAKQSAKQSDGKKVSKKKKGEDVQGERLLLLPKTGIGFGNLAATVENIPPGAVETLPDSAEMFAKAASDCCSRCLNLCCCMCCIKCCIKINNQCATVFSQLCIGLGCYSCLSCCSDICCSGDDT
ncbi:inter-alpha-trypsin inhibitor heavy chain H3-like [Trifolium pratense]|uniref:inter-alpha-trypsin inhibitor heavy chain H3-like n=1 Tax=Trifolium pratense TaxID=57577 RepID=UPI001E6943AF|nr:inter-alpha-trypsin inhibitor heavy chain H3-like [Trifolium pratense]